MAIAGVGVCQHCEAVVNIHWSRCAVCDQPIETGRDRPLSEPRPSVASGESLPSPVMPDADKPVDTPQMVDRSHEAQLRRPCPFTVGQPVAYKIPVDMTDPRHYGWAWHTGTVQAIHPDIQRCDLWPNSEGISRQHPWCYTQAEPHQEEPTDDLF